MDRIAERQLLEPAYIVDAVMRDGKMPSPEDTFRVGDLAISADTHHGIAQVLKIARELNISLPVWPVNGGQVLVPSYRKEPHKAVAEVARGIDLNKSLTCVPGNRAPTDTWRTCMAVLETFNDHTIGSIAPRLDVPCAPTQPTMSYDDFVHEHPESENVLADFEAYAKERAALATLATPRAMAIWFDLYDSLRTTLEAKGFSLNGDVCLTQAEVKLHKIMTSLQAGDVPSAINVVKEDHSFLDDLKLHALGRSYVSGYMNPSRVAELGQRARDQKAQGNMPTLESIGASPVSLTRNPIRLGFHAKLATYLQELTA